MRDRDPLDRRQNARGHRDNADRSGPASSSSKPSWRTTPTRAGSSRLRNLDCLRMRSRPYHARWQRVNAPRNLSAGPPGKPNDLVLRGLFAVAVMRPDRSQLPPLLEQIPTPIGGFDFVADGMCQRHLADLSREVRQLGTPIAERATEAMHREVVPTMRRKSIVIAMLLTGNTRAPSRVKPVSTARAALASGTLCSFPAFILVPGMVQSRASKLISPHVAPMVSPVRATVRTVNSSARAAIPSLARSSAMKSAISG